MKKLLTICILLLACTHTYAQHIFFKENFNSMSGLGLSGGWSGTWRTSDMYNLYCSYSYVPQYMYWQKVAAVSGCYDEDKGFPRNNKNVLCYTKSINLATMWGGAILKYDSYFNELDVNGIKEKATVEVSINDGSTWTTVQSVPKGSTPDSFTTWYVNLSKYVGYSNIRIGFRYSDQGQDQKLGGWAIDNIEVFKPEQKDLKLQSFSPTDTMLKYVVINEQLAHTGTVINLGADTIHTFTIKYSKNNSHVLEHTFNVSIPPTHEYQFTHPVTDTIFAAGVANITAWVETAGDTNPTNDTFRTTVAGVYFKPKKTVAVEEGNSTWNQFGPRGHVYMSTLSSDYNANLISIHSSDPMECKPYADYMYSLNYLTPQYFLLDRKYTDPQVLFKTFNKFQNHFGFADIILHGSANRNLMEVGVEIKPALDMQGDFKLILVITEDYLSGTGSKWAQTNRYATGKYGPMGDYHTKPDPVPANQMTYHFVARTALPSPSGGATFANELKYGGNYFYKFSFPIDEAWDKNKLKATVLLFRADDTLILNSSQLPYFLSVNDITSTVRAGIYPNPADAQTMLQFDATIAEKADVYITDMSGRRLLHIPIEKTVVGENRQNIPTQQLPTGLYIINIITPSAKHALKLQVTH